MDWKSHRIDTLLEQALVEDQAVSDATTNLTIDPNLRASASILARQENYSVDPVDVIKDNTTAITSLAEWFKTRMLKSATPAREAHEK